MKKTINQTWWDKEIKENFETFLNWVGDSNAESKIFFRNYLKNNNFKTIIDVGCGPATEFFALQKELPDIKYVGVDSSQFLNDLNLSKGVPMVKSEAHDIIVKDNSYEVAFCRHVLEHQPDFRPILKELIRISSKLATHIFFIKPSSEEKINYDSSTNLYHNTYCKNDIEIFLKENKKIKKFEWQEINKDETILLIHLN